MEWPLICDLGEAAVKIYVSLFGRDNYAWPICLNENVVLTILDSDLLPFWQSRDRYGFVQYAMAKKKTERGNVPNKQTASRWYGLVQNIANTVDDYWVHHHGDDLWWTISSADEATIVENSLQHELAVGKVLTVRKAAAPWSNKDRQGKLLRWSGLHPRARNILSTQSTQISISDENREYVLALLNGQDLEPWHTTQLWKDALERNLKGASLGKTYNARERTIWRIVATVKGTVAAANGQMVERVLKNKELTMPESELEKLIGDLLDDQDGLCNISALPLQLDGEETDKQMLCSLDRIDSSKHYEKDNLQLLCRFVNKWKSADEDAEFRRLMDIVKGASETRCL